MILGRAVTAVHEINFKAGEYAGPHPRHDAGLSERHR